MIESLGQDFVRTARSKGISERRVVYRHGLRAALTPVATIFGIDLAIQLTGAIFTERIFGLPGIGVLTLNAFGKYDLPVLMGGVLFGAALLVVMNLVVDIAYTFLDPRVRLG
jgi:peptide/nickel transport system permease protein